MKQFFKNIEIKKVAIFLLILSIGIFFRFIGINWDQGFHLHPDERFLTMVGIASKIPPDFFTYLNPSLSTLNPTNNNFSFFVYGIFPITLTKILAVFLNMNNYDQFNILGRYLSAIFDMGILLLVFCISKFTTNEHKLNRNIPYISSLLYAIAVFPIQLSHFFTTDIFLSFFMLLSFYFLLLFTGKKNIYWIPLSALAFGIAIACKITAIYILPLLFIVTFLKIYKRGQKIRSLKFITLIYIIFLIFSYLSVRIFDPYIFESSNLLIIVPNSQFINSLLTLKSFDNPNVWYPPGVQWISKTPVLFSLINIFLWGLGPIYFLVVLVGIIFFIRSKKIIPISITLWVIFYFFYQSTQFVKTMRYFIFLYPFFAVFAAEGFIFLYNIFNKYFVSFIGLSILIWPLMFINIYTKPHTRVTASYWIEKNIPSNSTILTEYWDDPLPLQVQGIFEKHYNIIQLHVFDLDSQEKWEKINEELSAGDYLILSSNRGWGSIPTVPKKYPQMTEFYQNLFAGKLAYKEVATFSSYPSLSYLGIPLEINDDGAEEAFTVFDHPKVIIFKKY